MLPVSRLQNLICRDLGVCEKNLELSPVSPPQPFFYTFENFICCPRSVPRAPSSKKGSTGQQEEKNRKRRDAARRSRSRCCHTLQTVWQPPFTTSAEIAGAQPPCPLPSCRRNSCYSSGRGCGGQVRVIPLLSSPRFLGPYSLPLI